MEYTIVNLTKESIDQDSQYFNEICIKIKQLLSLDKHYSFSVIFVSDKKIKEINKEYRNIDKITDVISFASLDEALPFELTQDEIELGDIFISVAAIKRQALDYGHSTTREASFLFTHGLLHLLGYDHIEKSEEIQMFKLQDDVLDDIISR